ncbi:MAG: hypothetical protein KAI72_09635 [Candidatus Pacebacteria bacterium]|nr:hypothetical protein [Candidatus Paceibacterota bacterium]
MKKLNSFLINEQHAFDEKIVIIWAVNISTCLLVVIPVLITMNIKPINRIKDYYPHLFSILLISCAILIAYEKSIQKLAKKYLKTSRFGGGSDITNTFFGSIENVVLKKRNNVIDKLNNFQRATLLPNPLKYMFDPQRQIYRIAEGILEYFRKLYQKEDDWNIRIAQVENNRITEIMVRCPESRNHSDSSLWNSRKSAFTQLLKSKKRTLIISDLEKAAKSKKYFLNDNEDISNRSLILHKVCNTVNSDSLLVISIKSPGGIKFSSKLEQDFGNQIDHFGDRLLIEYGTLQASLYTDIFLNEEKNNEQ